MHPAVDERRAATVEPATARRSAAAPRLAGELLLVGGAILLYFLVRGLTESSVAIAIANAHDVLWLEAAIGIDVEAWAQGRILGHHWLVTAANWVYIWGHWPVIVTTLIWLARADPATYRHLRNALFASGAIGLVCFVAYPVAPPRLLGGPFVDTVTELSRSYRVLQPPALVNKYAAMPSLHVGWNFLVGLFLYRHAVSRWARSFGLVAPAAMVAAVVLTANHYVLDAVVGVGVALAGLAIASSLRRSSSVDGLLRISSRPALASATGRRPPC